MRPCIPISWRKCHISCHGQQEKNYDEASERENELAKMVRHIMWHVAYLYEQVEAGKRRHVMWQKLLFYLTNYSYWWACEPILVLQQLWVTLIVAQVLHHLQAEIAACAGVDPFDVSLPILLDVLKEASWPTPRGLIATLVERGPRLGLIRPHRRFSWDGPQLQVPTIVPLPATLTLRRTPRYAKPKRPRHPRTTDPFLSRFVPLVLL